MNPPSDPSSPGADSDPGFDFVAPSSSRQLPAPRPRKTSLATPAPRKVPAAPERSVANFVGAEIDTSYEPDRTIADRLHRNRSQLSSFVTSTILHTIIFLVAAFWAFDREASVLDIGLTAKLELTDVEPDVETSPITFEMPEVAESPVEDVAEDTSDDIEDMASSEVPSIVDALPTEVVVADANEAVEVAPTLTLPMGGGLKGRDAESRAKLAARNGGSAGSEAAVELGLKWIINHQSSDGSWRFKHHASECDGRCGDEGKIDASTAATGLALMSLLGAGYTHQTGPYQGQVEMGLMYLQHEISYLSYGGSLGGVSPQPMYCHAIATIALAEAYAMTKDERLRKPVNEAYRYIVTAQHRRGGWRYNPQSPGDMSVTGWQVMAIKACLNAGVKVELEVTEKAKQFVDSLAYPDGVRYGYRIIGDGDIEPPKQGRKPSCTAIGNLLQMYLGRELEHPKIKSACKFLADAGSSDSDLYYNYYATLVLHHAGAPEWKRWNQTVRDGLVRTQRKHGHEAGSWFFPDLHGDVGGRLYTTAMAVMTLEVYYRFMPLYDIEDGNKVHMIETK